MGDNDSNEVKRTEDIGDGVAIQVVKIHVGTGGVDAGPVGPSNPFPVSAAALPLPAGAATQATLAQIDTDIKASQPRLVTLAPGVQLDAFGRLRTCHPHTIFESKQLNDSAPLWWDDVQVSGTASTAYSQPNACTTIGVSLNIAGVRVRQTFRRMNYEPGKSQQVLMTGIFAPEGGAVALSFVERKGSSDTHVYARNTWDDPLDGTGASGITLDLQAPQIFWFDMAWLGSGPARFGFLFNGVMIVALKRDHTNDHVANPAVYLSTPNLPLRYRIASTGSQTTREVGLFDDNNGIFIRGVLATGAAATLVHTCCSVSSEGGHEDNGYTTGIDRGAAVLQTGNDNNLYPLIVIRLQAGKQQAAVTPGELSVIVTDASTAFVCRVYIGLPVDFTFATGLPGSFTAIKNSSVEYWLPAAAHLLSFPGPSNAFCVLSKTILQSHSGDSIARLDEAIKLGAAIDGTSQLLVLAVVPLTGVQHTYASMNWQEEL